MFHKKTLSAAIAVALSFGVSAVQAADFQKYVPKSNFATNTTALTTAHKLSKALNYAYEQFGDVTSGKLSYPYRVRYTLTKSIPNTFDFYITFTLSGDATWGGNLSSLNLRLQTAEGVDYAAGTVPDISIVNKGSTADNTVSFLVNSSKSTLETTHILNFEFLVSNAHKALKNPGGQISLTANLTIAQTAKDFITGTAADQQLTTVLANSGEGTDITFRGPEGGNAAYISVVTDGKTFEGAGKLTDTQVDYGAVALEDKDGLLLSDAPCVPYSYLADTLGTGTASCGTGQWTAATKMTDGQILIEDGNFSASGKATDDNVYVDTTTKIVADEFTNVTTAKWVLDDIDLDAILAMGNAGKDPRNLVLTVTGDAEIIENRQIQPKGTLVITFAGGNSVTRSAFLRHLKKNGTVCTLYNIPPSNALDIVNIRVTNDSPSVDGFVKGKLRDMDNKVIFTGKTLIEQGNLKPHQTVRLQMEDLTADGASWTGRAVLVLESNIPHPLMQVYGLLRAREATGFPETPLMNMSTGATGNSCD